MRSERADERSRAYEERGAKRQLPREDFVLTRNGREDVVRQHVAPAAHRVLDQRARVRLAVVAA